ncbi:glycosyltransferase family 4 protein [Tundrisphaera lichenicola]|uniref:glycosyltransferase family 4 protein n=1 Tax=Tundrisphaera lichenicola TaxID=2029860 RepID=UPI003EBAF9A3
MKALALVEARDHVCCRYRVRAFQGALAVSGWSLTIEPLATGLLHRLFQIGRVSRFDSILLQRKLLPGWQLRELRRQAKHLVFDFDDAVLYRDSYDPRGPHHPRRAERFRQTVRSVDEVIAGNDFLAQCARDFGAHPDRIRVIPTCVAPNHASTLEAKGTGLELVWIGSSSTMAGLARQRALWDRIGREVPGVRLRMVCDRFLRFDSLPVHGIPWSEATEAADVAAADVGISWVPDDLWSRGKCGLKILQYQAAGLPVIANPVGVHSEMIRSGVNGFLVQTHEEWVAAVRKLADDPELRRSMGRNARNSVEAAYSIQAWSSSFVSAVAGARPLATLEHRGGGPPGPKSIASLERRRRSERLPPSPQSLAAP